MKAYLGFASGKDKDYYGLLSLFDVNESALHLWTLVQGPVVLSQVDFALLIAG